jgi:hypothetical protein
MLVKRVDLIFRKADFSPALNVGSKDHRYLKKSSYFFVKDGIITVLPKKKDFYKMFVGKEDIMNSFVKENNLSISKENQLVMIFDKYNELAQISE